jgi:hypothetical protein
MHETLVVGPHEADQGRIVRRKSRTLCLIRSVKPALCRCRCPPPFFIHHPCSTRCELSHAFESASACVEATRTHVAGHASDRPQRRHTRNEKESTQDAYTHTHTRYLIAEHVEADRTSALPACVCVSSLLGSPSPKDILSRFPCLSHRPLAHGHSMRRSLGHENDIDMVCHSA